MNLPSSPILCKEQPEPDAIRFGAPRSDGGMQYGAWLFRRSVVYSCGHEIEHYTASQRDQDREQALANRLPCPRCASPLRAKATMAQDFPE